MLDVSSWSESVTNRRPSTLKWGGGVELGPGARRDAYPSESDKKLGSLLSSTTTTTTTNDNFGFPKKMPKFNVFSTWVRIKGK